MGKYRRPRINFVLDEDIRDDLALWAEEEGRTMSNLVERIVTAAVQKKRLAQPQPPATGKTNGKGRGKRSQQAASTKDA